MQGTKLLENNEKNSQGPVIMLLCLRVYLLEEKDKTSFQCEASPQGMLKLGKQSIVMRLL